MRLFAVVLALALAGAGIARATDAERPAHPDPNHPEERHAAAQAEEHYHPVDPGALAVQALGFAILVFLIGYFAGPAIVDALNGRRERIRQAFGGIAGERQALASRRKAVETQLAQAERTSLERLEEARREGARLRESLVAEADDAAAKLRHKARVEAAIERAKMILALRNEVVDAGFVAAEAVIRETIDRETEDRLIGKFLDELADLSRAGAGGGGSLSPAGGGRP